jgi:hypothetical protein
MKTIALIDHHVEGHHLAFIKLFSKYLLKCGYQVFIFFPDHEEEIKRFAVSEAENKSKVLFQILKLKKRSVNGLGRLNNALSTFFLWRDTRKVIRNAEVKFNVKISAVFFSWLDDYLSNDLPHKLVDFVFPYKWSGLFFHPNYLHEIHLNDKPSFSSRDSVLLSPNCLSVGLHDENLVEILEKRINKPVVFFPEVADKSLPDTNNDLYKRIIGKKNTRIVIGLVGLQKRKGALFFMDIVKSSDPSKFFFVAAGRVPELDYSVSEYRALTNFISQPRENLLYHDGYITEGAILNSVVKACDVIFLAYHNFRSSSNFMTKAVHFGKRVLSSEGFWIGRITNEFHTGVCVPYADVHAALSGLQVLSSTSNPYAWDYSLYRKYNAVHDEQELKRAFEKCLGQIQY